MRSEYADIKAVGLDLDGTLVHTYIDYQQLRHWVCGRLLEAGVPAEVFSQPYGPKLKLDRGLGWLRARGRAEEASALTAAYSAFSQNLELSEDNLGRAAPFPGTAALLDRLEAAGCPFGVLTQGSRPYAEAVLTRVGLRDRIEVLITRDDYPPAEAKPAAEALYHLAERLDVAPAGLLYVGDLELDLLTARNAGVRFVAVSSGDISAENWQKIDRDVLVLPYAAGIADLIF